jgi:hypothetical protein
MKMILLQERVNMRIKVTSFKMKPASSSSSSLSSPQGLDRGGSEEA